MIQNPVAVAALTTEQHEKAQEIAEKLHLPFVADPKSPASQHYAYLLLVTPHFLGLQNPQDKKIAPFYIDFLSPQLQYRYKKASLKKELLARALGTSPRDNPVIIDATAGLGLDSFLLATLGFSITLLERSPIVHALLDDALKRALQNPTTQVPAARLELIQADATTWLQPQTFQHRQKPDVIYLDPMFPDRQKSASSKKSMVILQQLLLKDENDQDLFNAALACGAHRVVVKRPRLAKNIANSPPQFSLSGKSSRFDVYLI